MSLFYPRGWYSTKGTHANNFKAGVALLEKVLVKETAPDSGIIVEALSDDEAIGYVISDNGALIGQHVDVILFEEFHRDSAGGTGGKPTIATPAYGTTVVVGVGDYDINFTTGTGASIVQLNPLAAINTIVIISDLDAIAAANNITVDAGVGKTINRPTISQTRLMATDGISLTLKKVTATAWKEQ